VSRCLMVVLLRFYQSPCCRSHKLTPLFVHFCQNPKRRRVPKRRTRTSAVKKALLPMQRLMKSTSIIIITTTIIKKSAYRTTWDDAMNLSLWESSSFFSQQYLLAFAQHCHSRWAHHGANIEYMLKQSRTVSLSSLQTIQSTVG